jgi:hypothetical protein
MTEIQTPFEWLTSSPFGQLLLLGLALAVIALTLRMRRQSRALGLAIWMAKGGQFERAPQALLERMITDAERVGKKDLVLGELANVRRLYGHDGVRMGHVFWVMERMEGKIADNKQPPSFVDPEKKGS